MHRVRRRLRPLVLVVLAACLARPARAAEPQWVEVRSPHFTVLTDVGEKKGREVALRFEQMRDIFGRLFQRAKVSTSAPLLILAFRGGKPFKQVLPLWKGKPVEAAGFYLPGNDRNFIAVDLSTSEAWHVVFHEYAHMLLNANYPLTPPWFDEGFAEYFSTIDIGSKEVRLGDAPEGDADILNHQPRMRLVDLFSVARNSPVYNESGSKRTTFYAQSWLVVHYLYDAKKLPQAFAYFDLVENQGVSVPEAVARAFGMTPQQLEKEINDFSHSARFVAYTFSLAELDSTADFQARKLGPLEAQAAIADMQVHNRDRFDEGVAALQQIAGQQPDNLEAQRALGYAYLYRRDFARARQHFERAAQLDPKDARVLYYSALLANTVGRAQGGAPADPATMRHQLEMAVALDPEFADAYSLLGYACMLEGDDDAALPAFKQAIQLSPRDQHYQFNLAEFYLRQRRWDDAAGIFSILARSPDPAIATQAEQALRQVEEMRHAQVPPPGRPGSMPSSQATSIYAPQWRPAPGQKLPDVSAPIQPEEKEAPPDTRPIRYLKGTLLSVDCSGAPAAVLTVAAAGKTLKLRTPDRDRLVLIGADRFSCDWRGLTVSINYKPGGSADGDLVSLEVH